MSGGMTGSSRLAGLQWVESIQAECMSWLCDGETLRRAYGNDTDDSTGCSYSSSRQTTQCSLSDAVNLLLTREPDDDEIRSGASVENREEGGSFRCWREKNEPQGLIVELDDAASARQHSYGVYDAT